MLPSLSSLLFWPAPRAASGPALRGSWVSLGRFWVWVGLLGLLFGALGLRSFCFFGAFGSSRWGRGISRWVPRVRFSPSPPLFLAVGVPSPLLSLSSPPRSPSSVAAGRPPLPPFSSLLPLGFAFWPLVPAFSALVSLSSPPALILNPRPHSQKPGEFPPMVWSHGRSFSWSMKLDTELGYERT